MISANPWSPQYSDIYRVAEATEKVLVFAQHMDSLPIGRGLGAVLPEAVKAAGAVGVMSVGFAVTQIFPHAVAAVFTTDETLTDFAVTGLRCIFMLYPLVGFQMVTSAFFQSIGQSKQAILMSLTRQVIFLIPLLAILPHYWGIYGIWLSIPIADFCSITLAIVLLTKQLRELKKPLKDINMDKN